MNSMSSHNLERDTFQESRQLIDEQKLIEGRMQLEDEAESRKRRIKLRKQRQVKINAMRRAKRRARAFKLAGFWMAVVVSGFFAMAWYSNDVMALIR
ncbi:MAG: hypothetical protein VB913_09850 [Rhodospirillales bacterium]|jgi:hypothetical protein